MVLNEKMVGVSNIIGLFIFMYRLQPARDYRLNKNYSSNKIKNESKWFVEKIACLYLQNNKVVITILFILFGAK